MLSISRTLRHVMTCCAPRRLGNSNHKMSQHDNAKAPDSLPLMLLRRHWPVRSYPWGRAEALCSSHSDVPGLKRLLLELSLDDIKVQMTLPCFVSPQHARQYHAPVPVHADQSV